MNIRMLPPVTAYEQAIVANGRSYSLAPGAVIDVLDIDASILGANGWTRVALSGPTTARPSTNYLANPPYQAGAGLHFFDTTLSKLIVFDGATWRDPATGYQV